MNCIHTAAWTIRIVSTNETQISVSKNAFGELHKIWLSVTTRITVEDILSNLHTQSAFKLIVFISVEKGVKHTKESRYDIGITIKKY